MIFDTHCHLNDDALYPNIEEYINNAQKANVTHFLVVGWDYKSSLLAIKIAKEYPFCYASVGYHPCNIDNVSEEEYQKFEQLLLEEKVVALGEIGLDYHWEKDPLKKEIQKEWFIKQIDTANKYKKPIVIHNRESNADCLAILKEHKPLYGGIVHCYSGSVENIKDVIDLGLYISLGGPVTFTNAKTPKEVAEVIPLEYLLVETDSPYLAPHPLRGTINEPKNVALVVDEIAKIREMSRKHLEATLFENSLKVLHIKL